MKFEFSLQILGKKKLKYQIYIVCPVAAELFHAYGRTDGHDEANRP
jgi:hypothetical protein